MKHTMIQVAAVVIDGAGPDPKPCPMACAPERVTKRVPSIGAGSGAPHEPGGIA